MRMGTFLLLLLIITALAITACAVLIDVPEQEPVIRDALYNDSVSQIHVSRQSEVIVVSSFTNDLSVPISDDY